MTKHIILWQLNDNLTEQEKLSVKREIKNDLEDLKGKIEGLVDIKVNIHPLPSSNCDLMLDSTFVDEAAYKGYVVHPLHVDIAQNKVKPVVKTRLCLDFEE